MKIKYLYLFAISFLTVLFACTKDQNIQKANRTVSDQALIDYISGGNSKRNIEIKGSYAVLDGCSAISIAEIEKEMNGEHYHEPVKILAPDGVQYVEMEQVLENRNKTFTGGVVRPFLNPHMYNEDKIQYYLLPSINDDDDSDGEIGYCSKWKSAIKSAAKAYNKLGTRIVFEKVEQEHEADIIIGCDEDEFFNTDALREGYYKINPGYIAVGEPPVSGKPGRYISINNDQKDYSSRHMRPTMMHEFGHNLGFHHTDEDHSFQSCGHFYDYNFNANASIFKSRGSDGFHHTDIKSIKQLWPTGLKTPDEVSVTKTPDNHSQLVFKLHNPDEDNNPYSQIQITYRYNDIGTFYGKTFCAQPDENGYYTITWDEADRFRPGTHWDFWVRGIGHETMGQLPASYFQKVGSIN